MEFEERTRKKNETDNNWEIDAIVDEKEEDGVTWYKVRWRGFTKRHN